MQIVFLILRAIGGSFLLAVLLVLASAAVEFVFKRVVISTGSITSHWLILAPIYRGLKTLHFDAGAASTLLGTLAQIAGIFLGLYFAVVGTLVSTRYATVAPNVRELMIADKLGNQYIKLVALFGAVATLLLAAQSLGLAFGLLNVTVVTILGVATILSFVVLGRRAFEFFDPGSLANQLGSELMGWINRATRIGHFGRHPSFQAYYQKRVATLLDSYEGVVRMATFEEVARQHTLPYLAQHALSILIYYARRKHQLATESYWFRRQYEHKNWLTTNFTETSLALRTGTALSPKEVPDLLWFEKEVVQIFWLAYTTLLDGSNSGQVANVSLYAAEALGRMGEYLMMIEALQFAGSWAPLFRREAMKTKEEDAETEPQQEQLVQRLGIVESYALGTIRLFLSFATSVSEEQNHRLHTSLSEPNWLSGDQLFTVSAPRGLIIELERLKNLVSFEYEVEGVRRTVRGISGRESLLRIALGSANRSTDYSLYSKVLLAPTLKHCSLKNAG